MNFDFERSRDRRKDAASVLKDSFPALLKGCTDAEFLDADQRNVIGVTSLPMYMPVTLAVLNNNELFRFVSGNTLFIYGRSISVVSDAGTKKLDSKSSRIFRSIVESFRKGPGSIGENGEHIIDLKAERIGLHYDVNLLLGNRIGYPSPLITTPKAALDSFGRGSFRADASRQVLATKYDLRFEDNGEPTNRQFYLYEDGKQIFYSANPDENVKEATCRHLPNRSVIRYETECGLIVTRTIFILPQEEGMPEASEAQFVHIENTTDHERHIKIAATGTFGLCSPESMTNDLVYASITHEGCVLRKNGKIIAIAPSSYPKHLVWQKRFAVLFHNGEPMDEYCTTYNDFFGKGTLEHPEFGAHLRTRTATKLVSFFAMAKTVAIAPHAGETIYEFVGYTGDRSPDLSGFDSRLNNFVNYYSIPENADKAYQSVVNFISDYSSYVTVQSKDHLFDSYVNHTLPFQVLYQSFVSRSFAWTQKAYREIGFREIQDLYASVYYMCAMGQSRLAKEMLSKWISNVYRMGYANHNFYDTGKEPGMCSDDGLWLVQAIYRYVTLTGDKEFLNENFPMADGGNRRLMETLNAVVEYSGRISVGAHGFPLMDKADWNDTMKLDDDWINGEEKEKRYQLQLETKKQNYGVKFESNYSESVMNAFLLKIALDEANELASLIGYENTYGKDSENLKKNLQKYAWKKDFFARAMIGAGHPDYTYLGASGDGLSADDAIDGTYFLNSFSWSILSDVATENQIRTMLKNVRKYLWTPAGMKLCTPAALERLANGTAAGHYYPGDRENGGIFKHAAMMAVTAMFKAAKTVSSEKLSGELTSLAYEMLDKAIPYKTLENPYVLKGNPRFCTQYNNAQTGENCGPMLSGTASWLSLAVFEILGIGYTSEGLSVNPVLPPKATQMSYTIRCGSTVYRISITKPAAYCRRNENTKFTLDDMPVSNNRMLSLDGKQHNLKIQF